MSKGLTTLLELRTGFSMLTTRQQETIEHIKAKGINTPDEIIKYCLDAMKRPWKTSYTKHPNAPHVTRRRHGRKYYHEIIKHYTGNS